MILIFFFRIYPRLCEVAIKGWYFLHLILSYELIGVHFSAFFIFTSCYISFWPIANFLRKLQKSSESFAQTSPRSFVHQTIPRIGARFRLLRNNANVHLSLRFWSYSFKWFRNQISANCAITHHFSSSSLVCIPCCFEVFNLH